ncbi:MAG: hypothetical protein SH850_10510, partial [Planctomycetaceae bacterium]|nr:hypothetical protein [Planctomycetaceae bacterium]
MGPRASQICAVEPRVLLAAPFLEFVDPNPSANNGFGQTVTVLSTGNVVVTAPNDDFGGSNAGAVYLFNGATGALISTLRGSATNDNVGSSGIVALPSGNFLILSPDWSVFDDFGAVTWGSGTTGVSGVVSAANSLVGNNFGDHVGGSNSVTVLTNGNYVVRTSNWDSPGVNNAGAVTWGNGTTGITGNISAANSLVGSTANDNYGQSGVTALTNGNYVVASTQWDNAGIVDAGAVTWGNGATGTTGVVSAANSLVGSAASDA